jgi:uncharacterized membrane protein
VDNADTDDVALSAQDSPGVVVHRRSVSVCVTGPWPQAQEFALYEESCPGAGNRILAYMEAEQAARHKLQDMDMRGALRSEMWGLAAAYSLMLCLVGAAFVLALYGQEVIAGVFLGAGVLGAVYKFIDGRPPTETAPKEIQG